jgi:hypothetical protein
MAMGYICVDIDVDDIIDEIESSDMIEELESRGYEIKSYDEVDEEEKRPFTVTGKCFNSYQLHRHLCDIVGCGYHEPKQSVLDKLKEMM